METEPPQTPSQPAENEKVPTKQRCVINYRPVSCLRTFSSRVQGMSLRVKNIFKQAYLFPFIRGNILCLILVLEDSKQIHTYLLSSLTHTHVPAHTYTLLTEITA